MMKPRILLIEGKRSGRPSFLVGLTKKGYVVESVANGSSALARMTETPPDVILVDVASMRTSGKRIFQSVHHQAPGIPVIVILPENFENNKMDAQVVLVEPFTVQKLLNRIRPLLPKESKNLLKAGPFQLDVEQRWVRCNEHQIRLTPRLVALLKLLIDHAGEVIDRKLLFQQVWETDYLGDTRTLDVHVSWLRQAVEADPRHPRYIKTIRGVGYRLDIDADTHPRTEGAKKK
jgi:DNA-binding response OmpR family regulator